MNCLHILGIFLKNLFLTRRSFPRLLSQFYWVTVELFFWGFITVWLRQVAGQSTRADWTLVILSALIFWNMFIRAQQSFTISFLEDIWSRNIANLFASPLKLKEFIASLIILSVLQGLVAFIYISIVAFVLYALQIWTLGFYIIPFFLNILFFGWALGLFTISLIIRFGPSADILAFSIPMLLLPLSAVYYPLSIFPAVIQKISFFLPTTHLFEGMRAILTDGIFPWQHLAWATGLNLVYFSLGLVFFYFMVRLAKKKGLIARLLTD